RGVFRSESQIWILNRSYIVVDTTYRDAFIVEIRQSCFARLLFFSEERWHIPKLFLCAAIWIVACVIRRTQKKLKCFRQKICSGFWRIPKTEKKQNGSCMWLALTVIRHTPFP